MKSPLEAIILAAGRGSRLNEMTANQPKCLTEIAGHSLLEWQIMTLKDAGIERISVIRGYLKETLNPATLALDFKTIDNDNWAETNMVSTLTCANELLDASTCIISYSDILYATEHVKALLANTEDIAISYDTDWEKLWRLRMEDPLSDAETFIQKDGLLTEIGQKTTDISKIQGQYMGLIKITQNGWKQIRNHLAELETAKVAKLDMTSLLSALLEQGVRIGTTAISGNWLEVDTVEDYQAYCQRLKTPGWSHDWR